MKYTFILGIFIGLIRGYLCFEQINVTYESGYCGNFEGKISEVIITKNNQEFVINTKTNTKYKVKINEKILFDDYSYIKVYGCVWIPEDDIFKNNMKSKNLSGYLNKVEIIDVQNAELTFYEKIRKKITSNIQRNFYEPYAGLILGMSIGNNTYEYEEFENQIIKSGVAHMIAISGFNISIIFNFITGILTLFVKRKYSLLITCFLLVQFCIIAGGNPPVFRAVIMATYIIISQILGVQNNKYLAYIVSVALALFINPLFILSVSMYLSASAMFSMIFLTDIFKTLINIKNEFYDTIISYLIALFTTLPIQAYFFKTYSPISFFSNILLAPTAGILSVGTIVLSILALMDINIFILNEWMKIILTYFIKVTQILGSTNIIITFNYELLLFLFIFYIITIFIILSVYGPYNIFNHNFDTNREYDSLNISIK